MHHKATVLLLVILTTVEGKLRPLQVTDDITTPAGAFPSPIYKLPTWRSSLTPFGVKADGDVHISLINLASGAHVNVSLSVSRYDRESQVTATGLGDPVAVVSLDKVHLDPTTFTWFCIFRKRHVIILVRYANPSPLLVYTQAATKQASVADFIHLTAFQVWSLADATWDFKGDHLRGTGPNPTNPLLLKEVVGVFKGVMERVLFLDEFLYTHPGIAHQPHRYRDFEDLLDDLIPYYFLLKFFGHLHDGALKDVDTTNIDNLKKRITRFKKDLSGKTCKALHYNASLGAYDEVVKKWFRRHRESYHIFTTRSCTPKTYCLNRTYVERKDLLSKCNTTARKPSISWDPKKECETAYLIGLLGLQNLQKKSLKKEVVEGRVNTTLVPVCLVTFTTKNEYRLGTCSVRSLWTAPSSSNSSSGHEYRRALVCYLGRLFIHKDAPLETAAPSSPSSAAG